MKVNFNIKLSNSQREIYDLVHNDKYKYITVVMSRQSGKSVLCQVLCVEWLLEKNNSIAYVCRNFILAKKIYRDLIRILPKEVIKTANGSDLLIETIYGSTLNFYSAEQGASLRGNTFTHMINDEMAFHKQEQTDGTHLWNDILSPTLKARGKKCIFVSTPLSRNNIFYEMYMRGLSDDYPSYVSVLKDIYQDGFVTEDEIEEIRKSIPDMSFRTEYLCEWADDAMTFFQGFSDCFDIERQRNGNKYWVGIDLSGDGQDATILTSINEHNEVTQYEINGTLDNKYREIASIIDDINPIATYLEINGLGNPMANEIKKLVRHRSRLYDWVTTNQSKEEIVSSLAVAIANRDIHFEKDDGKLYNELGDFICTVSKTRKLTFQGRNGHKDDRIMSLSICLKCKEDFKYVGLNPNRFVPSGVRILK